MGPPLRLGPTVGTVSLDMALWCASVVVPWTHVSVDGDTVVDGVT